MTQTSPVCATWCIERWICSWSYWLYGYTSTMVTFSLAHGRLVCCCCALVGAIVHKKSELIFMARTAASV